MIGGNVLMNFKKLKKETCEMVGMSKMISNIKYILNHYTCNGYSLILDSIKFDHIKRNVFVRCNFENMQQHRYYDCFFNIVFDENMHISDLTYDSEEQCLKCTANIATRLLQIAKKYFDYKIDLLPIRVNFVELRNKAVRALELGETHLFNVKDENTTTPKSVIHGFEKDNELFVFEPEKFI